MWNFIGSWGGYKGLTGYGNKLFLGRGLWKTAKIPCANIGNNTQGGWRVTSKY